MKLGLYFSTIFSLLFLSVNAQKKILDTTGINSWIRLKDYGISDNGKYCWYGYGNFEKRSLVVQTTYGTEKMVFQGIDNAEFSPDSRKLVFRKPGDTLAILDLATKITSYLPAVNNFRIFTHSGFSWLIYSDTTKLILKNLQTQKSKTFASVRSFFVEENGAAFLMLKQNGALDFVALDNFRTITISHKPGISNITFSPTGTKVAFNSTTAGKTEICFWKKGTDSAVSVVSDGAKGIKPNCVIADQGLYFDQKGDMLYFSLREDNVIQKEKNVISGTVTIYAHKDMYLNGQAITFSTKFYRAACPISLRQSNRIIQLEDSSRILTPSVKSNTRRYVLVQQKPEPFFVDSKLWDNSLNPGYQLLDMATEKVQKYIPKGHIPWVVPKMSPSEKYIVWRDWNTDNIYSYEISTGTVKNWTSGLSLPKDVLSQTASGQSKFRSGIEFFNDSDVALFTDKFDVWKIDFSSKNPPICITENYGRKNNIEFNCAPIAGLTDSVSSFYFFDHRTGSSGFARIKNSTKKGFEILCNDPVLYKWGQYGREMIRAKNAEVYLGTRETASSSPNLYTSFDLRSFTKLSDIHPEKEYNWITSELVRYPTRNAQPGIGILYKPENFDATKRYPLIFNFYQERHIEVQAFLDVSKRGNTLPIAEYVSAGYLVFVPDIVNDKPGQIAKTTVNSVVCAAEYLVKSYPFVDGKRLGLQGHSFGGYETNILIANSNLFAAANASAGLSNLVTEHGSIGFGGMSLQMMVEVGQFNLGYRVTPWNNPQVYEENSPLFQAENITTPLLLNCGRQDDVVLPIQSSELFLALRRMKRPVWLLSYDTGHTLGDKDEQDFAIRQRQFFDHFLMGKPAPIWMTHGISFKERGLKSGFELDSGEVLP